MLLRLAYLASRTRLRCCGCFLAETNKDIEILSLRHQLAVLQRQLDGQHVRFKPSDRARPTAAWVSQAARIS
jgi:putative transposase